MEASRQAGKSQQAAQGCGMQTVSHPGPHCLLDRARIMTIITEIQGALINSHLSSQAGISSVHLTTLGGREELRAEVFVALSQNRGKLKPELFSTEKKTLPPTVTDVRRVLCGIAVSGPPYPQSSGLRGGKNLPPAPVFCSADYRLTLTYKIPGGYG